jgi:hypothetical protein
MKELVETVARALVTEPESVAVAESSEGDAVVLDLTLSPESRPGDRARRADGAGAAGIRVGRGAQAEPACRRPNQGLSAIFASAR